ncbi:hypothetical protein C7B65_18405 [Phormidesmis priestleyi ULC007]|uniref:Transketolase n=1 Tax=Phormidesmis priestleyi ULC007 TaxID=1920490 RepID=A0A2T1DAJ8_9CYAN|nr:hypothetical protein [Phormidesmis priestleyi]PSB17519.1 hypothetical protein C7B65_18405 [Phormidesmis priestleyi ULC007]PZO47252.1 MAG: hypothetical protein DCF14_20345 [Phormidesmis priestleyi]
MSHRPANKRTIGYGALVSIAALLPILSAQAHNVKTSSDVAALFHIEPDHNPKAGQSSRAWFVLTRKGGELIALEKCNCKLEVHQEPHKESSEPLLEPPLKAISAEQYQGVPGAEIVFPKAGIYELELSGTARDGQSFQPFELSYSVTVQSGEAAQPSIAPSPIAQVPTETAGSRNGWLLPGVAIAALLGVGVWLINRK